MALVSKVMKFEDEESMIRFFMLYQDLFKPWSESVIKQMDYVADRKYVKKDEQHTSIYTRGHHDKDVALLARKGIKLLSDNRVKIHIEPDDFKSIERNFKKVKVRANMYEYVLEG